MALTLDQAEKFFTYLGIDPKTVDDKINLNETFDKDFIRRSAVPEDKPLVKKIIGERMGSASTKIVAILKSFGAEITDGEIKDKMIEEVADIGLKKLSEMHNKTVKELEGKVGLGKDEEVKQLNEQLAKQKKATADEKSLKESVALEYDTYKKTSAEQRKVGKIKSMFNTSMGKAKYAPTFNDMSKKGLMATIEEKYRLDLDDPENIDSANIVVTDSKGEKIKSEKRTGEFMTLDEIIEKELKDAGGLAQADNKPKQSGAHQGAPITTTFTAGGGEGTKEVPVHPKAAAAAEAGT